MADGVEAGLMGANARGMSNSLAGTGALLLRLRALGASRGGAFK